MSRSLDDLSPLVRPLIDKFLSSATAAGLDLLVTCTLRSEAEQTALYAQGRTAPGHIVTNAKPGQSAHNYGLAIDFVPMINGKPCWDGSDPAWEKAGEIAESCGLEWAGRWTTFREEPHVQLPNWVAQISSTPVGVLET
jgi:peptidoglycan L-alanyl-D-glutamate endopeptidase CwlK